MKTITLVAEINNNASNIRDVDLFEDKIPKGVEICIRTDELDLILILTEAYVWNLAQAFNLGMIEQEKQKWHIQS